MDAEQEAMLASKRGAISAGTFLAVFVVILIGVILYQPIQDVIDSAVVNASATVAAVLNLVPVLYVLLILAVIAGILTKAFKG